LRWTASDGPASASVTVRVTDPAGASDERSYTIRVVDVAPRLVVAGPEAVEAGATYTLNLAASDPGQDPLLGWVIDWGDGTTPTSVAGTATSAGHVYDRAGSFSIIATARNDDGSFAAVPVPVKVTQPALVVTGLTIRAGALHVRFSTAIDASVLGPDSIRLNGSLTGPVLGAVQVDADRADWCSRGAMAAPCSSTRTAWSSQAGRAG
jgi:hypothetical protein